MFVMKHGVNYERFLSTSIDVDTKLLKKKKGKNFILKNKNSTAISSRNLQQKKMDQIRISNDILDLKMKGVLHRKEMLYKNKMQARISKESRN